MSKTIRSSRLGRLSAALVAALLVSACASPTPTPTSIQVEIPLPDGANAPVECPPVTNGGVGAWKFNSKMGATFTAYLPATEAPAVREREAKRMKEMESLRVALKKPAIQYVLIEIDNTAGTEEAFVYDMTMVDAEGEQHTIVGPDSEDFLYDWDKADDADLGLRANTLLNDMIESGGAVPGAKESTFMVLEASQLPTISRLYAARGIFEEMEACMVQP